MFQASRSEESKDSYSVHHSLGHKIINTNPVPSFSVFRPISGKRDTLSNFADPC